MTVQEMKHLDGLVGNEETDDGRLQQVFVVLLDGGDGRLIVVGDLMRRGVTSVQRSSEAVRERWL